MNTYKRSTNIHVYKHILDIPCHCRLFMDFQNGFEICFWRLLFASSLYVYMYAIKSIWKRFEMIMTHNEKEKEINKNKAILKWIDDYMTGFLLIFKCYICHIFYMIYIVLYGIYSDLYMIVICNWCIQINRFMMMAFCVFDIEFIHFTLKCYFFLYPDGNMHFDCI